MTTAVDDAVEAIRATAGVTSATAQITPLEASAFSALNDFWTASIEVKIEADAADFAPLAETVAGHVASARESVDATAIVRLPAAGTGADIVLALHAGEAVGMTTREMARATAQTRAGELADAALTLRQVEHATRVTVADGATPTTLTVESPDALGSVIAELRTLPQFATGALSAVTVTARAPSGATSSVTTTAASPSPGLSSLLSELATRTDVDDLTYSGQRSPEAPGAASTWRPSLRVLAQTPQSAQAITELLTDFETAQPAGSGVPRASFTVLAPTNGSDYERDGFIGLALGSPTPDDYVDAPQPEATDAAPDDPEADARARDAADQQLQADVVRVTELLADAGDTAGIRGVPTVAITACESEPGEHVRGSVVLPIFEITDSPMAPADALIRSWTDLGFVATDRAMGTDRYTQQDESDSLRWLTFRGTADGLSLGAESVCIASDG
ncbi:hypothetical protein [Cryobacterium melibiosiphilum]|uniref:hypothetical protein n=1 Tax=Cryobacterium melibiosiphilum TaxID=995039 RepID=UPI0011C23724|nr:hypothetical protein [Cryobacterium melibiosiphilum]